MKLLFCRKCQDVFKLDFKLRKCNCGETQGLYLDKLNAEYSGVYAVPLGFNNHSLAKALNNQPKDGLGKRFDAFVIPQKCDTMFNRTIDSDGIE